ncbi:MAG: hypothetical protein AAB403_08380 [Planctomycetota bacterium]
MQIQLGYISFLPPALDADKARIQAHMDSCSVHLQVDSRIALVHVAVQFPWHEPVHGQAVFALRRTETGVSAKIFSKIFRRFSAARPDWL